MRTKAHGADFGSVLWALRAAAEEAEHYSHAPGSQGAREKPERLVGQPGLFRASCPRPCLARDGKRQVTPTLTLTLEGTTECSLIRHTTRVSFPDGVSMRGAEGDLRPRTTQAAPPSLHILQQCRLVSWISAGVKKPLGLRIESQ